MSASKPAAPKANAPGTSLRATPRARSSAAAYPAVPAIWTAFAKQSAWKGWALLFSLGLNLLLALAAVGFADKPPDVVLVDSSSGESRYLRRGIAGEALLRFLNEQRQEPSDVTVVHFSTDFLRAFLAVNSTTVDAAWGEALSMMAPALRERMAKEATASRLVETFKLAGIGTELTVEKLERVERRGDLFHVRAVVARAKSPLRGGAAVRDRLEVDLIERIVPRTALRPDGLEPVEYRNRVLPLDEEPAAPAPLVNDAATRP